MFQTLDTEGVLQEAQERSLNEPVVLFKHSATCGTSSIARRQMLQLTEDTDPPVYELVVQTSRALSNHIAALYEITHQSPQVIVLHKGQPVFNTSHGRVKADTIREVAANVVSPSV